MIEANYSTRLKSLDALRGFDMLWIMGLEGVVISLFKLTGGSTMGWFAGQMEHVPWSGFHMMDLVFPLFLFIAGVSFPFSLAKRRAAHESTGKIYRHLVQRALILVLFGILYSNGGFRFEFGELRFASVLARIGLAWFFAAIIFVHTHKNLYRVLWTFMLLLGYGLLMALVPAPDAPAGTDVFSSQGSIIAWFDRCFLPGKLYEGNFDPEGILGVIPATGTALIGMLTGVFLAKPEFSQNRKTLGMGVAGIALVIAAILLNSLIPINKALWSPSFVLVAGGISILLLALFYWMIDVKGYSRWSFPLMVVGLNSITIYMAQNIIGFQKTTVFFFGGVSAFVSEEAATLIYHVGYLLVCWGFLWFLYQRKVFLKV